MVFVELSRICQVKMCWIDPFRMPGIQSSASPANHTIIWRNRSRSVVELQEAETECLPFPLLHSRPVDHEQPVKIGNTDSEFPDKEGDRGVVDSMRQPTGREPKPSRFLKRDRTKQRSPKLHMEAWSNASVAWCRGHGYCTFA